MAFSFFLALGLASFLLFTVPSFAIEIIGHRGASHDAPENTPASFRLGWQQGAEGVELDIYLSKDGEVVVMHDANTKRTAGLDRPIAEQTLAELRTLDAGSWKGPAWAGEKIPALAEVVAAIPDGRQLYVEIKCGPEVLPALEKVIAGSGKKPEQMVLIGFNRDTMAAAKERLPQLEAYWIVGYDKKKNPEPSSLEKLVSQAKSAGLDGLDLQGTFPVDRPYVDTIKAAGLKLGIWTVDDPALAKRLMEAGVDSLTTNRPGWLREQLGLKVSEQSGGR